MDNSDCFLQQYVVTRTRAQIPSNVWWCVVSTVFPAVTAPLCKMFYIRYRHQAVTLKDKY